MVSNHLYLCILLSSIFTSSPFLIPSSQSPHNSFLIKKKLQNKVKVSHYIWTKLESKYFSTATDSHFHTFFSLLEFILFQKTNGIQFLMPPSYSFSSVNIIEVVFWNIYKKRNEYILYYNFLCQPKKEENKRRMEKTNTATSTSIWNSFFNSTVNGLITFNFVLSFC